MRLFEKFWPGNKTRKQIPFERTETPERTLTVVIKAGCSDIPIQTTNGGREQLETLKHFLHGDPGDPELFQVALDCLWWVVDQQQEGYEIVAQKKTDENLVLDEVTLDSILKEADDDTDQEVP